MAAFLPHRVLLWNGSAYAVRSDLTCVSVSEGCGTILGNAVLQADYGLVANPGALASPSAAPFDTTPRSQYMLVQISDGAGGWIDLFYGFVTGEERIDNGATMGEGLYHCTAMAGLLARYKCLTGWEMGGPSSPHACAGYVPPFNACAGGDRTALLKSIRGVSRYIHDRTASDVANPPVKWSAKDILDYLLTAETAYFDPGSYAYLPASGSLTWVVSDPQSILGYIPPAFDVQGQSVLEVLNTLVTNRRGMTWRCDYNPSTTTATITVRPTTPVSYSTGSYTLPASALATTVDLTGVMVDGVRLTWSEDTAADIIDVAAAQPWTAMTLVYDPTLSGSMPSLIKGWTTTDETNWNSLLPGSSKAWCRFVAPTSWDGQQYNNSAVGLGNVIAVAGATDPLHGEHGLTGSRSYSAATVAPSGGTVTLTRDLPAGAGWTTSAIGTRADAQVMLWNASSWVSLTPLAAGAECWHLDLEDIPGPCAVHVGNNYDDQFRLAQTLQITNAKLLVTVGVRESMPLRVSWRRAQASWPRSDPRVLAVALPQFELWTILTGTIKDIVAGSPVVYPSTAIVRDDRPHLKAALALLTAFYANPARSLTWRRSDIIDTATTYQTGALITGAILAGGTETVNAVVTRRSWDLTEEGWGTSYSCQPLPPDVESVR